MTQQVTFQRGTSETDQPFTEAVNHPDHYQGRSLEAIDVIEDFNLNFSLGNVVKYVLRAGKKNPNKKLEDLQKAKFYLEREIQKIKKST